MGTQPSIKIRTLPRAEAQSETIALPQEQQPSSGKAYLYLSIVGLSGLMAFMIMTKTPTAAKRTQQKDFASIRPEAGDKVTKYLQDAQLKSEMMKRSRQMENLNLRKSGNSFDVDESQYDARNYGVQMDSEDTASRVFDDLHDEYLPNDQLPADKINARLAKNRWTNELERRERVTFVREFIKSAFERGYEVQIDQNLVVVGVKKLGNQKVSIDQVLNKMAKQGL